MKVELEEDAIKTGLRGNVQDQAEAIRVAYERYANPIAAYIREKVAPTLDCHELTTAVNDVFIELARKVGRGNFQWSGSLKSLLFEMGRCNAIDQFRKESRYQRHFESNDFSGQGHEESDGDGFGDDEMAAYIAKKLQDAPELAAAWRSLVSRRTAADETAVKEVVRLFRMWVAGGSLPKLQRRVAEELARHYGNITDMEIRDEIGDTGERPTVASVKSARREIREKFISLMEKQERSMKL